MLEPQEWPNTRINHVNDPRVWAIKVTHEDDPRVWQTKMATREWPRRSLLYYYYIFLFHLQYKTFLAILPDPSKQSFCSIYTLNCRSIFSMQLFNLSLTVPKAPVAIGITSTFFNVYNWPTSYFNLSQFFSFSSSFFLIGCQMETMGQSLDTFQFSSRQL